MSLSKSPIQVDVEIRRLKMEVLLRERLYQRFKQAASAIRDIMAVVSLTVPQPVRQKLQPIQTWIAANIVSIEFAEWRVEITLLGLLFVFFKRRTSVRGFRIVMKNAGYGEGGYGEGGYGTGTEETEKIDN